jgi:hypothetical protein
MGKLTFFGLILLATTCESFGDAIIRLGLQANVWPVRIGWFALGAALLFAYGVFLNLSPVEFSRAVGLYIATLFVMFQVVNLVVFRTWPSVPSLVGGALVVTGGLIVAFWNTAPSPEA